MMSKNSAGEAALGLPSEIEDVLAAAREVIAFVQPYQRGNYAKLDVGAEYIERLGKAVDAADKIYHPTIPVYVETEEDRENLTRLLEERIPEFDFPVGMLPPHLPVNTVYADIHGHVAEAIKARSDARKADNPKGHTPSSERGPGSDTYPTVRAFG